MESSKNLRLGPRPSGEQLTSNWEDGFLDFTGQEINDTAKFEMGGRGDDKNCSGKLLPNYKFSGKVVNREGKEIGFDDPEFMEAQEGALL